LLNKRFLVLKLPISCTRLVLK